MVTMERLDQMMKEAQQETQEAEAGLEALEGQDVNLVGVQVNRESRVVTLYHRETGEPRTMPFRIAVAALKKRFNEPNHPMKGQLIFSRTPTREYALGAMKCWLHPDAPDRAKYDRWGLPICYMAHLRSEGEARMHMQKRHPSAFKAIQEAEEKAQRSAELEASRTTAQAVLAAVGRMGKDSPPAPRARRAKRQRKGNEVAPTREGEAT